MKKIIILILMAVIVFAAFLSNPDKNQHEAALAETIEHSIQGDAPQQSGFLGGLKRLGTKFVSGIASELISSRIDYHNYVIFSTTTFNVGGQEHTLSWGVFGQVVIRDTDALVDEIL